MNAEKLPQPLRRRLTVLFKEILALNMAKTFDPPLDMNRLSGAVFQALLQDENRQLTEDEQMDLAVNLTCDEHLPHLLDRYDASRRQRATRAKQQTLGIVNNMIPQNMKHRDQVIADTLDMLDRFRLVKSIPGIRTLVQARLNNNNQDVDELDYLRLK